jgi:pimeloyl-ACP methyl ester carboxylesterase
MTGSILLSDGRRLAYLETGPGDGIPVIYCHGAIGTPLGRAVDLDALAGELGIRYVAISRPGVGGSDPCPGRTVLSFAADVTELADALEIERFMVVGVSAGGPYALALARELGTRVTRVAVCSSLSPLCAPHETPGMERRIRLALCLLAQQPELCGQLGDQVLPLVRRRPAMLSRVIAAHAAPGERARLRAPAERLAASTSFLDATAGGARGLIDDYLIYSRAWGFSAAEVESEVHLWHGVADPLVPIEHALQLAVTLPRCRMFFDPDEGHHFFRRRLPEILGVLVDRQHVGR